jgi:hypothetical protein
VHTPVTMQTHRFASFFETVQFAQRWCLRAAPFPTCLHQTSNLSLMSRYTHVINISHAFVGCRRLLMLPGGAIVASCHEVLSLKVMYFSPRYPRPIYFHRTAEMYRSLSSSFRLFSHVSANSTRQELPFSLLSFAKREGNALGAPVYREFSTLAWVRHGGLREQWPLARPPLHITALILLMGGG